MHVIIVRWRIKPEAVAAFEQEMRDHVAATRATEPGCLQFDVCKDKAEPNTYHCTRSIATTRRWPTMRGRRHWPACATGSRCGWRSARSPTPRCGTVAE